MRGRWQKLALAACFALGLVVNLQSVQEEFLFGHKGWCAARRAVAGRNFVRHGFAKATFGPVENLAPKVAKEDFEHYWHHPVGIHLLVGASFTLFGVGEWQARIVPVILMMLGFLLFADMARRWWPRPSGRFAALLFFITTPMLAYYGPFVNQEALVLLTCLASLWSYIRWKETGERRWVVTSVVVAIVGAWSDWPWFVFALLLAIIEALDMVRKRRIEVRWMAPYCIAVLVGFVAIGWHLAQIYGGEDFIQAIRDVGRFRQSGKGKGILAVLTRQGPRWTDLFTPTLVLAGLAWPFLAERARRRGEWSTKHSSAIAFLVLGASWVLIFRQGAWVHDYWPMFAAVYFVIAGADVVVALSALARRAASWRPGPRWGRQIATSVALVLIMSQSAAGLAGTHYRTGFADPDPMEGEDYRQRHAAVARWINTQTTEDDLVAIDDKMLVAKFQFAFYLDRRYRRLHLRNHVRALAPRDEEVMAVVDLRSAPQEVVSALQRHAVRTHPVTILEDFLIVDFREKVESPKVTWLRLEAQAETWTHRWLTSHIYPPQELRQDPWLEGELLLAAGYPEMAQARVVAAQVPTRIRQHVAAHHLARASESEHVGVRDWLGELGVVLDTPIDYAGKLSLIGYRIEPRHRDGEVVEAIFEVNKDPGKGWRPFFHRLSKALGDKEAQEASMPMAPRILGPNKEWAEGDLVVMRTYSGLNAWRDRVRYRLGFWRPPTRTKGDKDKKPGNDELKVVKGQKGIIERLDWRGRTPAPWPLSWLPYMTR